MKSPNLPTCVLLVAINVGYGVHLTTGSKYCDGYMECVVFTGYTCKNNKCVCDPSEESRLFPCIPPKSYGERCNTDQECMPFDQNLYCIKSETRVCRCRRGYFWDSALKKCLLVEEDLYNGKFDPVRDLIIPAIIIMTIGAMVYLGIKLFCNCGKMWRRRRHQDITRELEEISATPHQQATWIASYRVFSPYNNSNRPSSGLSPTSFPIHPTPCMGLFVPSQSLSTSPPPYEEALKHKVILSSYHTSGPPVVPAYTLPPPDVSRQYQTLPANASGPSSTIILNPNAPTASTIRISTMSGPMSLPVAQTDNYQGLSSSHDQVWTQLQYSGAAGQIWSPHHPQTVNRTNQEGTDQSHTSEAAAAQHTRLPQQLEVWTPQQQNIRNIQQQQPQQPQPQQPLLQHEVPRTSTFRPGQSQRTYQTNIPMTDTARSVQSNVKDI